MAVLAKDGGAQTGVVFCGMSNATQATPATGAPELITAGAAGDNTMIVGNTINRNTYGMPESALVVVTSYYSLGNAETLSLAVELQESADGSSWDTAEAIQAATVVVTASGATTNGQTNSYTVKMAGRQQYIRFNVTPNLSRANTDTCEIGTACVLFSGWNASMLPAHQVEA